MGRMLENDIVQCRLGWWNDGRNWKERLTQEPILLSWKDWPIEAHKLVSPFGRQTVFSNAFSCMKITAFLFRWHGTMLVPKCRVDNIAALITILAWHRTDDKLLFQPMMPYFLTHICVIWSHWVIKDLHVAWSHSLSWNVITHPCPDFNGGLNCRGS